MEDMYKKISKQLPICDRRIVDALARAITYALTSLIYVATAAALYVWCPRPVAIPLMVWSIWTTGYRVKESIVWCDILKKNIKLKKIATAVLNLHETVNKGKETESEDVLKLREFLGK